MLLTRWTLSALVTSFSSLRPKFKILYLRIWSVIRFDQHTHAPQRMHPLYFGDIMTFPLAARSGQNVRFAQAISVNLISEWCHGDCWDSLWFWSSYCLSWSINSPQNVKLDISKPVGCSAHWHTYTPQRRNPVKFVGLVAFSLVPPKMYKPGCGHAPSRWDGAECRVQTV